MNVSTKIVEVDEEKRTARVIAEFEVRLFAEACADRLNSLVMESWYNGKKESRFCWVPSDSIMRWCLSYGYCIVE